MTTLVFDVDLFRAQFPGEPEFANETIYPDALLSMFWDQAICYVSDEDYGYINGDCRQLALNLLTAHLVRLYTDINGGAEGEQTGFVSNATIDKISVTVVAPKQASQFVNWLNQTPYGQQLVALLSMGPPVIIGGINNRTPFRQTGGTFIQIGP